MHILTWHGAIVRLPPDTQRKITPSGEPRLLQEPIWLTVDDGLDFHIAAGAAAGSSGHELGLLPGPQSGTVHIKQGAFFLSAAPSRQELSFDGTDTLAWETFLLIEPADLADLRHILANRWKTRPGSQMLDRSDIRMGTGFVLEIGAIKLDLPGALPLQSYGRRRPLPRLASPRGEVSQPQPYEPPSSFVLRPGDDLNEEIVLAGATASEGTPEMEMRPRRTPRTVPVVTTTASFRRDLDCELRLPLASDAADNASFAFHYPPIVCCDADRAMVSAVLAAPEHAALMCGPGRIVLRRQQRRHVLLAQGGEGAVFDRDGSENDPGLLAAAPWLPAGFARREGRLWIDLDMLKQAPKFAGSCLVFYDARLHDYASFLLGSLVSLEAMVRHAPAGAKLLMPAALRQQGDGEAFDHGALMRLLGFDAIPIVDSPNAIVWAEDVIFASSQMPDDMPADALCALRDRARGQPGSPSDPRRRLFVQGPGLPLHPADLELRGFLVEQGFTTISMDTLGLEERIRLFQEAEFIVAAPGAALADIVFAGPGTKVLEILPDRRFDPRHWLLSSKLGLTYGVLGGEEQEGAPPDIARFTSLFRMLANYR